MDTSDINNHRFSNVWRHILFQRFVSLLYPDRKFKNVKIKTKNNKNKCCPHLSFLFYIYFIFIYFFGVRGVLTERNATERGGKDFIYACPFFPFGNMFDDLLPVRQRDKEKRRGWCRTNELRVWKVSAQDQIKLQEPKSQRGKDKEAKKKYHKEKVSSFTG